MTTNVPYGYKHDSDDPKKWVIDEEAAQIVKRIFALCMEGKGPSQIAALLEKERVLNPTAYKQWEGRKTPHQTPENEYRWHESTVAYILEYMEYTGCTVNFKTYTNSIWDKKQRENPMENRKIFYNTHPAIISLEVFDKVQEIRQQRHRRTATGKSNMFSGLVFCNDCKQKLYYSTTSYFEKRQDFFICSTHRVNKDKCSGHYIRAVVLEQIVWKHIQEVISVSLAMRLISVPKWSKSSVCRAKNRCGCIRSGWHRLRNESESLTVFSSAFTRTMLSVGWTMNASP